MARIPNGILGSIQGRIGPVSGYNRYGIDLIRSAKNDVIVKATPKRKAQREKIKICNIFSKAFAGTGFFSKTFPAYGHAGSGYNRAIGALMNLALMNTGSGVIVSYPKVLISKGPLPTAEGATAMATSEANIQFNWANNADIGTAKKNDKVVLVAYFPGKQKVIYSFDAGTRESGTAILKTTIMDGEVAETWVGFLSSDEKDASCSVYTGALEL